jgi:hypothetical protein
LQRSNEKHLSKAVSDHFKSLIVSGEPSDRDRARLGTAEELSTVLRIGTSLVRSFFADTSSVPPKHSVWTSRELQGGDDLGLARCLLREMLGEQILLPIDQADKNGFRLEVII